MKKIKILAMLCCSLLFTCPTVIQVVPAAYEEGLIPIKVAHMPYGGLNAHYFAWKMGYDRDSGLKIIKFSQFISGPPLVEAGLAGEWAVAPLGGPPTITTNEKYYNLYIVGACKITVHQHHIIVRANSPILQHKGWNPNYPNVYGSPETIRGCTALVTKGTNGDYALDAYLKVFGLSKADINVVSLSQTDIMSAMSTQGDIFSLWDPFCFIAESQGYVKAADETDLRIRIYAFIVAWKDYADANSEAIARWIEMFTRANHKFRMEPLYGFYWDYKAMLDAGIATNPQDNLLLYIPETAFEACDLEYNLELFKTTSTKPKSTILSDVEAMVDFMYLNGYITKKINMTLLVTDKFLNMVVEKKNLAPTLINDAKGAISGAETAGVSDEVLSPLKDLIDRAEYLYNDGAYFGACDAAQKVISSIQEITGGIEITSRTVEVIPTWLILTNIAVPIVVGVSIYFVATRRKRG